MTVFSVFTPQKFTNYHAIRSWNFHNICNKIGWPRFLRHPVKRQVVGLGENYKLLHFFAIGLLTLIFLF